MSDPIRISDHAILRYLERVGGFEIERLRKQLEVRLSRTAVPGAASVLIDGYRYLLKIGPTGLVVVTVLEKNDKATNQHEGTDQTQGSQS